jgi:hypothetical protein
MKENINLNEETSQSQESKILDYMLRGNRITGMDALQMFACFRLPARIADIEKRGFKIQSQFITTPTGKRVKQYWI